MTDLARIRDDLAEEQQVLDRIVSGLTPDQWAAPTPSEGWTVADQIGHLTYFDGAAAQAITEPEAFAASIDELVRGGVDIDALTLHRGLAPPELLDAWRRNRARLAEAATGLDEGARVAWYGPSMSARSFLTARLMEVWAHGQDVVDAVGAHRDSSDRLAHIARLGVITRGWSYVNRGLPAPGGEVGVDLVAPSGERWQFGPTDAPDRISGPAVDFCLVVTQRRNVEDTRLVVEGEAARDWMSRAQAFAGPATDGPAPAGGPGRATAPGPGAG
jgi:uncharacterized protein (TIGR03084 family)